MFEKNLLWFTNDDGTGWRATVPFLVLYENGYDNISVYDGGWYEWLMHDDYPVQVGDPASDECFTQQLENFLQEKLQNKT